MNFYRKTLISNDSIAGKICETLFYCGSASIKKIAFEINENENSIGRTLRRGVIEGIFEKKEISGRINLYKLKNVIISKDSDDYKIWELVNSNICKAYRCNDIDTMGDY